MKIDLSIESDTDVISGKEVRGYVRKLRNEIRVLQLRLRDANKACEIRVGAMYDLASKNRKLREDINLLTEENNRLKLSVENNDETV